MRFGSIPNHIASCIKLKDLDAEFIERLRAESGDEEAEVTIWLPGKANPMALSEDAFWAIVDELDWEKEDGEEVIRPAVDPLSRLSVPAIEAFADWFSEKLYLLDGELYAKHAGKNAFRGEEAPFSADEFLYARCYVVGRGKAFFEQVLAQPDAMPDDRSFEAMLRIAPKAYRKKTGQPFRYQPATIYETFANPLGWPGSRFLDQLLSS